MVGHMSVLLAILEHHLARPPRALLAVPAAVSRVRRRLGNLLRTPAHLPSAPTLRAQVPAYA